MATEEEAMRKEKDFYNVLREEIFNFLPLDIRNLLLKIHPKELSTIEEIRLRAGKPLMLESYSGDWFVNKNGGLEKRYTNERMVFQHEIIKALELMSQNSIYAFLEDIKNGYITLRGGHRVGISGRTVVEGGTIKNIKDISGLNIRVSKEVRGCSQNLMKYIVKNEKDIYSTLLVSPPQCGKTTMLRDIARNLSDGFKSSGFYGIKVGVVDERSEIASCHKGIAQNDIGVRTDVLDGCPKAVGMAMMLRSMSPKVIITDEIGNTGDFEAVMQVINAGTRIIASAHGYNISELKTRKEVLGLIEQKAFERYIVLDNSEGPGTIKEVIDGTTMKGVLLKHIS
ncbi:MAG TPA: stage III sporulation protein AA [Pseudobacteroides sp.]|uniref:stage III sporulation protein AA n=1 Tax=Pseudobacteroides sp. TaxID=1968840 RepID=UPI002F92BDB7